MRGRRSFRPGKAGRKRSAPGDERGRGGPSAHARARASFPGSRLQLEPRWEMERAPRHVGRGSVGLPSSALPLPASTLGSRSLKQRPCTTHLHRLDVRLRLWLQNSSFPASATVTGGGTSGLFWLGLSVETLSAVPQAPGGSVGTQKEGKWAEAQDGSSQVPSSRRFLLDRP